MEAKIISISKPFLGNQNYRTDMLKGTVYSDMAVIGTASRRRGQKDWQKHLRDEQEEKCRMKFVGLNFERRGYREAVWRFIFGNGAGDTT
eukprot:10829408-Heterocapsa_arctica.AAC.1